MKKKLAELLIDRKMLNDVITDVNQRMHNAATYQKDGAPAEDVSLLLVRFIEMTAEYSKIDGLIAQANQVAKVPGKDMTVAAAIIARDLAKRRAQALKSLLQRVLDPNQGDRWNRDSVPMVAALTVQCFERQANLYARDFRELDVAIQQANWNTEVEF